MNKNILKACNELAKKHSLSGTEHHIVMLIAQGCSPLEISDIRERSIETIRTQIKQVMHKVGVNRANSIALEVYRLASGMQSQEELKKSGST